jgi:hypothetical protein
MGQFTCSRGDELVVDRLCGTCARSRPRYRGPDTLRSMGGDSPDGLRSFGWHVWHVWHVWHILVLWCDLRHGEEDY